MATRQLVVELPVRCGAPLDGRRMVTVTAALQAQTETQRSLHGRRGESRRHSLLTRCPGEQRSGLWQRASPAERLFYHNPTTTLGCVTGFKNGADVCIHFSPLWQNSSSKQPSPGVALHRKNRIWLEFFKMDSQVTKREGGLSSDCLSLNVTRLRVRVHQRRAACVFVVLLLFFSPFFKQGASVCFGGFC